MNELQQFWKPDEVNLDKMDDELLSSDAFKAICESTIRMQESMMNNEPRYGFPAMEKMMEGVKPGSLYYISAGRRTGKTMHYERMVQREMDLAAKLVKEREPTADDPIYTEKLNWNNIWGDLAADKLRERNSTLTATAPTMSSEEFKRLHLGIWETDTSNSFFDIPPKQQSVYKQNRRHRSEMSLEDKIEHDRVAMLAYIAADSMMHTDYAGIQMDCSVDELQVWLDESPEPNQSTIISETLITDIL